MTRIRWYGPTLVLVLTLLVVMLAGPAMVQRLEWYRTGAQISLAQHSNLQNSAVASLSEAFRNVARAVRPSIVHIQIEGKVRESALRQRFRDLEERLPPWFRLPLPEDEEPDGDDGGQWDRFGPYAPFGNGSGWVFDQDGHIVTNFHVIEHAEKIVVKFSNKSHRVAHVVGTDAQTDIAVLKVEGSDLHPAILAETPVEQGEIVFAFGSPFGYEFSMSQGIVSAKGRQLGILRQRSGYENFIQTDASINRGNSGGPLTNILGQVVGMNTAIATRGNPDANFNGMGFAIPGHMIRNVVTSLIEDGKVVRGYLGVAILDLDEKNAWTFGYEGKGVLVELPQEGFPAAEAGLQPDDIITGIDDTPIISTRQLQNLVAAYPPGATLNIQIYRGKSPHEPGQTLTISVELVAKPENPLALGSPGSPRQPAEAQPPAAALFLTKLGLDELVGATDESAERFKRPMEAGVIVASVRRRSVAYAAGIRRGDLISEIFGVQVTSKAQLLDQMGGHDTDKPIRLRIKDSSNRSRSVFLELPDDES